MERLFGKIDKPIFIFSSLVCLIFISLTLSSPENMKLAMDRIFHFFITHMGGLYILSVAIFVIFLLIMAFGRFGSIKLGKDDERPDHSLGTWFAMLFAAGMGCGLLFWGVAEPVRHFTQPPFGAPQSPEAAMVAIRTTFFHWGVHPWACFGIVALALAYFSFRKGLPLLVSSIFYPLLGEKGIKGPIGKAIDTLTAIITLFGLANTLGMGAMQVSTGIGYLWGIPDSMTVCLLFLIAITVVFIVSASMGIERGISVLSKLNILLAALFVLAITLMGPTLYIWNTMIEAFGNYLQNFVWLSFFMDSQGDVARHTGFDWMGSWTIFYWAWWICWAPYIGIFVARISRGRTIREFVCGITLAPTLLSIIWFSVMGGTALDIETKTSGAIARAVAQNVTTAVFEMFNHLPMGGLLSLAAIVILTLFLITSADSATFTVGIITSGGTGNPSTPLKVLWGALSSALAAMLILTGGLSAIQSIAFVITFPFLPLMLLMTYCLYTSLAADARD